MNYNRLARHSLRLLFTIQILHLSVSVFCQQRKWQVKTATVLIAITTPEKATSLLSVHTKGYTGNCN